MGQKHQPDMLAFRKPDHTAFSIRRMAMDWLPTPDWLLFIGLLFIVITVFGVHYLPLDTQKELTPLIENLNSKQWYLNQIRAQEAWSITSGSRDVIVAVVDTGVDYTHNDLSPNIWSNSNEIPDDRIDNDNNGYIDDYFGWDFVDNDGYPMPGAVNGAEHGTMMAGIIGAVHDGAGIDGVNGNIQIMPIRVRAGSAGIDSFLPCNEGQYPYYLALGIKYAVDNGANVINLSLSTSMASQWLGYCVQEAIWYADKERVVIVTASGNKNENSVAFPGSLKQVIAVGATDEQDRRLSIGPNEGSNYGDALDVVAPGVDILTTTTNNQYKKYSGTSLATAQVSGLAALLFSMEPPLSADQVRNYIETNTQKLEGYHYIDGWNEETGWGRIDVYSTLSAASLNSQVSALK